MCKGTYKSEHLVCAWSSGKSTVALEGASQLIYVTGEAVAEVGRRANQRRFCTREDHMAVGRRGWLFVDLQTLWVLIGFRGGR
jgi:hypothetical protein